MHPIYSIIVFVVQAVLSRLICVSSSCLVGPIDTCITPCTMNLLDVLSQGLLLWRRMSQHRTGLDRYYMPPFIRLHYLLHCLGRPGVFSTDS